MTVLYCSADLHLDGFPWSKREEFYGDAFRALESFKERILTDPITSNANKAVLLGGDITDKPAIEDDTAMALRTFIGDLYAEGIYVYYVNGNHDVSKEHLSGHAGVFGGVHIHGQTVQIGDFIVHGLDWVPRGLLQGNLATVPECDILVMHCAYKHLLSFRDKFDLDKDELPTHLKDVFVGDIHVTDVTTNKNGTRIVSPGPLHPCSIQQKGPHGVMRICSDTKEWEFIELDTRHVLDYNIDKLAEFASEDIANEILAQARTKKLTPHCVIRYNTDNTPKAEQVMSLISKEVYIHAHKNPTADVLAHIITGEAPEETSLEKEIDAYVETYPLAAEFVKTLLHSKHYEKIVVQEYNKVVVERDRIPV